MFSVIFQLVFTSCCVPRHQFGGEACTHVQTPQIDDVYTGLKSTNKVDFHAKIYPKPTLPLILRVIDNNVGGFGPVF